MSVVPAAAGSPGRPAGARERILEAACGLFARRGIRDVGVDGLIEASGVARATFYRHFRSKDDLVLAYLGRRNEERRSAIEAAIRARAGDGAQALLAVFDVFEGWFGQDGREVAAFVQVLIEMGPGHPLGRAAAACMASNRARLEELAREAGLLDPAGLARSLHILVQGAIVADLEGYPQAAARAKAIAALLLDHNRP